MTETNPPYADEHKVFSASVVWKWSNEGMYPYSAEFNGQKLLIRVNDFPADEYVYSLFIDGKIFCDFNGWPDRWVRDVERA